MVRRPEFFRRYGRFFLSLSIHLSSVAASLSVPCCSDLWVARVLGYVRLCDVMRRGSSVVMCDVKCRARVLFPFHQATVYFA